MLVKGACIPSMVAPKRMLDLDMCLEEVHYTRVCDSIVPCVSVGPTEASDCPLSSPNLKRGSCQLYLTNRVDDRLEKMAVGETAGGYHHHLRRS